MHTFVLSALAIMGIIPAGSFLYGQSCTRKSSALYLRMIVDGVGCIAVSRIFLFVKMLTEGSYPTSFHVGILGLIGVFAFFFTANFGQIDALCDDGSKELIKYRLIPLAWPVFLALLYAGLFIAAGNARGRIILGLVIAAAGVSGYYHLKHLIFPDVELGVIQCLRPFNILALAYSATVVAEMIFLEFRMAYPMCFAMLLGAMISGAIVPVTMRGVKKWTT